MKATIARPLWGDRGAAPTEMELGWGQISWYGRLSLSLPEDATDSSTHWQHYIMSAFSPAAGTSAALCSTEARPLSPLAAALRKRPAQRLLLVDDEEPVLEVLFTMVRRLGFEADCFSRAGLALDCFRAAPTRYAMVISDCVMPGMTGMRLSREILAVRPGTPIVLVSGDSSVLEQEADPRPGTQRLLLKPFTIGKLEAEIASALCERNQTTASQGS